MIREYIVKEGDTIKDIATREYGNTNQWVKVCVENNLDYPYIGKSGVVYTGKVLVPGDKLILTNDSDSSQKVYYTERNVNNANYLEILMGVDIGLTDGDLVLTGSKDGIDLALKRGMDNIVQAIQHKFKVKKGTYRYYPGYGTLIHTYIGQVASESAVSLVKAEAINTLHQDQRVESIKEITAEYDGMNQIAIDAKLGLIGNNISSIAIKVNTGVI